MAVMNTLIDGITNTSLRGYIRKQRVNSIYYATGGPLSKYRVEVATRLWRGSEAIIPLTKEEARLWAERHLAVNTYEQLFGTAIE